MRCCSIDCDKRSEYGIHCSNSFGTHQIEDLSSFGSGTISDKGAVVDYWCGSMGNYEMFQPIRLSKEEFVVLHCRVCGVYNYQDTDNECCNNCRFINQLKR